MRLTQVLSLLLFGEHGANLLHILPYFALLRGVAQKIGRIEGRHQGRAVISVELAAHLRDGFLRAEESARRCVAKGDDDFGARGRKLSVQIWREERKPLWRYLVALTDDF